MVWSRKLPGNVADKNGKTYGRRLMATVFRSGRFFLPKGEVAQLVRATPRYDWKIPRKRACSVRRRFESFPFRNRVFKENAKKGTKTTKKSIKMNILTKNPKIKFFDQLRNALYHGEIITVGNSQKVIVAETDDVKADFKKQQFTYEFFSDLVNQKSIIPA